jgi:hypothetical protein
LNVDDGPAPVAVIGSDAAMMGRHDFRNYRQPEAGPTTAAGAVRVESNEPVKYPNTFCRRYSRAVIADTKRNQVLVRSNDDLHERLGMTGCIVQQIAQHPRQRIPIAD